MRRLFLLASLAALLCAQQQFFSSRKLEDEFVGAWNLISYERRTAAGEISYPMGRNPVGRLTYDARGRMSAQIMRPDRPQFHSPTAAGGTADEKTAAFDGYIAYYGTYTLNQRDHTVIHHVEASLYPNWVGSDQLRTFEFSEGRLILSAVNAGEPGTESRLVWERAR
jgi:Lipocalin-like domain